MDDFNLNNYFKTNMIIWSAIVIGMLTLVGVTYFLDSAGTFQPVDKALEVKNILFALILISALAVLFLKRSLLSFDKIYSKVKNSQTGFSRTDYFARLRSNYIIIWAISESILVLGLVEFIFLADFKSFLLYAAVGLYAISINFPRKSIFEIHLNLLAEKEGFAVE